MKKIFLTLLAFSLFAGQCYALDRVVPEKNREDIISNYLEGRDLDLVEGIWSYADGDNGEVAIVRTNLLNIKDKNAKYNYAAIKLSGDVHGKVGEGKFYLKKTTSPNLFMVIYIYRGAYNSQYNETYSFDLMSDNNILEASNKKETQLKFVRIDDFARQNKVSGKNTTANDNLDSLKKLGELRDAGVITEEEFNQKKKELLERI